MNELDNLTIEAANIDASIQPEQLNTESVQPEQPVAAMSVEEEAGKIIEAVAFVTNKFFPDLQYSDETKSKAGNVLAPVMVKYGFNDTLFAKWGVEFEAGMFFGGLIYASYLTVKASKEEQPEQPVKRWYSKFFKQ
jgi:hypothetical protein